MSDHICATCRHLRPWVAFKRDGTPADRDPFQFECAALEVVAMHRWGTRYERGDIVTGREATYWNLETEPLLIRDPEHTETDSAGRVIRADREPMGCSAWNADPLTIPVSWEPKRRFQEVAA